MQRARGLGRCDKRPPVTPRRKRPVGGCDVRCDVREREAQHRMRENILPLVPLEHESIGSYPFVDREQAPARINRIRRVKNLDQSDKQFNSVVCHQLGPWRQAGAKSPAMTEESTEQESSERTASSGPLGRILVDCWPVYGRKLVRDPNSPRERPNLKTEARKLKPEDSCGVPADESYVFFFLDFLEPPSIEILASTSFSADCSFFFSAPSNFCRALRSLSLREVPLVNLMKPITNSPVENNRPNQNARIILRDGAK